MSNKTKYDRPIIGALIREHRLSIGICQETLAAAVGVKRQTLSAIEQGKFSVGIDLLGSIADALGCTVELIDNKNNVV